MKTSELKDMDLRELLDQLNSLDFENVGGWPAPVKFGVAVIVLLVVLGLGWFLWCRRDAHRYDFRREITQEF